MKLAFLLLSLYLIHVQIHIMQDGQQGVVHEDTVRKGIADVNAVMAKYKAPFEFQIDEIEYVNMPDWWLFSAHLPKDSAGTKAIISLRRGDAATLNIFTGQIIEDGYLGFSSFPWDYKQHPDIDSVLIDYRAVDDSSVFVHEIGHWLGLRHIETPTRSLFPCQSVNFMYMYPKKTCARRFDPWQIKEMEKQFVKYRLTNTK